jgi:DnaJ like chaperone protein
MQADEQRVLRRISEHLGFSLRQFQQLEAMVRAQRAFHAGGDRYQAAQPQRDLLAEAYAVLGVAASASNDEVKKAYRRLMNQHHPDKLVAKGMPEEMIKLATEKTQEIKAAYETIKKARGN